MICRNDIRELRDLGILVIDGRVEVSGYAVVGQRFAFSRLWRTFCCLS